MESWLGRYRWQRQTYYLPSLHSQDERGSPCRTRTWAPHQSRRPKLASRCSMFQGVMSPSPFQQLSAWCHCSWEKHIELARREKKFVEPTFSEQECVTNASFWLEYNPTELGAIMTEDAVLSRYTNTRQDSFSFPFPYSISWRYKFTHWLWVLYIGFQPPIYTNRNYVRC